MDSLIEAAEKNFEAKTPLHHRTMLAMRVFKLHLFKKCLMTDEAGSQKQNLVSCFSHVLGNMKINLQSSELTSENPIFTNALWTFYFENALNPIEDISVLSDFIRVALELKRNSDVKRLIEIGLNSQFVANELFADDYERTLKSEFFDLCSLAFNLTRNLDRALALLRKVEQREDMSFSITLFNNVIECCLKCKQEHVAEDLLNEYAENVDKHIRKNYHIVCTLITGYSKLGKVDKALELYTEDFNVQKGTDKENLKFLNTTALNALLEGCIKKNYIRDAEMIFNYHLQAEGIVDETSASSLVKGFCKAK